jgi:hypothetical protein
VSSGVSGLNPEIMGLGPIEASRQALARAGMSDRRHRPRRDQRGVRRAGDRRRPSTSASIVDKQINVHGGAIALGHPFGMTGARIMTTLIHGLQFEADKDVRPRDDVRRRRPGHGDDHRAPQLTHRPEAAHTDVRPWAGRMRRAHDGHVVVERRCAMRALVVYESMFGNTHVVADRIAEGAAGSDTRWRWCRRATSTRAPSPITTSSWSAHPPMRTVSRARRHAGPPATRPARTTTSSSTPSSTSTRPGLREWLDAIGDVGRVAAAAFDTRVDAPAVVTGRASKGIARRLERHGFRMAVEPESFLVDRHHHLCDGEGDRAFEWGPPVGGLEHLTRSGQRSQRCGESARIEIRLLARSADARST